MIQICRAESGQVSQVDISHWDIKDLDGVLQDETGIPRAAILAYLADGQRLRNDNIRELSGLQDHTIYVFNKHYLDVNLDDVLEELRVEPQLQPPVEDTISATPPFRPSILATSYFKATHTHHELIKGTLLSLHYQQSSLRIASGALDLHVLAMSDAFDGTDGTTQDGIAGITRRELERQASLLAGVDVNLEIVSRVNVHKEFLSNNMRRAIEIGDRGRTLGDYVNREKMGQVKEACTKTHRSLQVKFKETQEIMVRLRQGADEVRAMVSDQSLIEDADACTRRSLEIFDNITGVVTLLEKPSRDADKLLKDLRQLDVTLRSELQHVTQTKNSYTTLCIRALRRISALNNDLVQLPQALTSLQAESRAKTSFIHLQRLQNMLFAYGATVVEVVRRKEFARFFFQRAQSILEVMAKLSANEKKRRQVYRSEVNGQLPFDPRGMETPVPTIDFSPTGSADSPYSLERTDVEDLVMVLDDLEHFARESSDPTAVASVREARTGIDRLIGKMDTLESGFDRIAERSLLSSSRLSTHRRRFTEIDDQVYAELERQVEELRRLQTEKEATFQAQRAELQAEVSRLKSSLEDADAVRDQLDRDLHCVKAQLESEATSRRILEERNNEMSTDADGNRSAIARALADATEQTRVAELLRQELAQARADFEDVKALETRNADKVAALLEEQTNTLQRLEGARARGEDLEAQIQAARTESDGMKLALSQAGREKDRLLRAQASEHDRIIRDHIAEADGDRAVLEHQFSELKAALEDSERQLKDTRSQLEVANADAVGLREELQRIEHELREARHVERVLRDDIRIGRASQEDYELRLENSGRLVAQILNVALMFRDSHVKALVAAQNMTAHPGTSRGSAHATLLESAFGAGGQSLVDHLDEPSPIDPTDPAAALEMLRGFDHDRFLEAINKTSSTIRKWQKQCKEYRERAKGKISFRNFARGDLALFLPTRNSVSKPWAAFNVSFPHYFLQATGHLADQLKTREWIVARITSITERIVDQKDSSSNPFGLGDGVKYYMLEVEDWTQPTPPSKRRASGRKHTTELPESPAPVATESNTLPSGPPEPEVEETFNATKRLFPSRSRANSSSTAGPSSLSRLLAQAIPVDKEKPSQTNAVVASPESTPKSLSDPSPVARPSTSSSPVEPTGHVSGTNGPNSILHSPSPRRPASRASRISTSSRFSSGRMPFGSSTRAGATTALSDQPITASPSSAELSSPATSTRKLSFSPSPEGSPTDGLSNLLGQHRRRTTSYHVPRASPLSAALSTTADAGSANMGYGVSSTGMGASASSRLASLASSWGVSFGRRRKPVGLSEGAVDGLRETGIRSSHVNSGILGETSPIPESPSGSASELMKRVGQ